MQFLTPQLQTRISTVYRQDHKLKHGGKVFIYIRNNFQHKRLFTTHDLEAVAVQVNSIKTGCQLNIICAQRSPSSPVMFWQELTDTIDNIYANTSRHVYTSILRDFNVNIKDDKHQHYSHFQSFCNTTNLQNIVTTPTRLLIQSTLDLALVPRAIIHSDRYMHPTPQRGTTALFSRPMRCY